MNKASKQLIVELTTNGYSYRGINDIYKQRNLPPIVVDIILDWLPDIYQEHVGSGEHLCRSLISAVKPFRPAVLIDLFENSNYNSTLKWTLAYVLAISKTDDISEWLLNHLIDKEESFERGGFLYGLPLKAKIKTRVELMEILEVLFDKYYEDEYYLKLYQKYAIETDIPFLEKQLNRTDLYISLDNPRKRANQLTPKEIEKSKERYKKALTKMIEKISSRKVHAKFPVSAV